MASKPDKLDDIVAKARIEREMREQGYREQALRMYPHVCGRCAREFNRKNLHELTVHHRDHDHLNNPPDGSNWELLCIYCHENEHQRMQETLIENGIVKEKKSSSATYNPFSNLKDILNKEN